MSIADMQRFAELRRSGQPTVAARLELSQVHQAKVELRITDLQDHFPALAEKIRHYEGLIHEQAGTGTP